MVALSHILLLFWVHNNLARWILADDIQHEQWDKHNKSLGNFILLKSSPQIFFLPAKHNKKTRALLADNAETMAAFARGRREQAGAVTARKLEARLNKFIEKAGKTKAELEAPPLDVPEPPIPRTNGSARVNKTPDVEEVEKEEESDRSPEADVGADDDDEPTRDSDNNRESDNDDE